LPPDTKHRLPKREEKTGNGRAAIVSVTLSHVTTRNRL
jgi:hypothetical protein